MKRVIQKYKADLSNHLEGNHKMYRNKEERRLQVSLAGGSYKDTWFRSGGATSTLTVPASPWAPCRVGQEELEGEPESSWNHHQGY